MFIGRIDLWIFQFKVLYYTNYSKIEIVLDILNYFHFYY